MHDTHNIPYPYEHLRRLSRQILEIDEVTVNVSLSTGTPLTVNVSLSTGTPLTTDLLKAQHRTHTSY